MARIIFTFAYFTLIASCLVEFVRSHTPHVWMVGLREGQTIEKHLDFVGRPIPVEERRPEINGYTASISDDDTELFKATRKDPDVGFVVKMPEDYFRKIEKIIEDGWDEDDRDLYEYMTYPNHHWHNLQGRDYEILVSDEGELVYFVNGEQEKKKLCRLIQADPRVDNIGPVRGYKMNDEIHDNPHNEL
ncbi:unnamed protein product [Aureobasidium vineae]|uniref:Uncharacterized protein n=1 Tax=Aureobasidium vineae TaxID=2773715 RepID=A0A9N8PBL4_9PEZI|nr:unnamed protein product [Aureobasidium vineae]